MQCVIFLTVFAVFANFVWFKLSNLDVESNMTSNGLPTRNIIVVSKKFVFDIGN